MDEHPYRPPQAPLGNSEPPTSNTLGWKIFFWALAMLTLMAMGALPPLGALSIFDKVDLALTIVTLIGIFGFAYYHPVLNVVFWRYFFYVVLFDVFLLSVVFPLLGVPRYGHVATLGIDYLFELLFSGVLLFALYGYAYRRPFIWVSKDREAN